MATTKKVKTKTTDKNARRKMGIWDRYADFVYRVATGNKKLKILTAPAAIIIFFGLVVLFIFASFWLDKWLTLFHFGATWWSLVLSWLLILLGWAVMLWPVIAFLSTRGTPVPFHPPRKLITTGPYAYVRNPMVLGLFIFMLGLGVLFGSLSLIFIFTPLFIAINVFYIKAIEENEMEKKFGKAYLEYKKKVPMFFPGLRKLE